MRAQPGPDLPVPEADFARLLRADATTLTAYARELADRPRARLALFCYARTHLREAGLTVARECSRFGLTMEGGTAGAFLFEQASAAAPAAARGVGGMARVSISTARLAPAGAQSSSAALS